MANTSLPYRPQIISRLTIFVSSVTALCCFNLVYFLAVAANPLIQSDAWYFFDANVTKWINHGFNWSDLFIKRGVTDHAQPLNKFFLYLNYRFFHLDFTIESLAGLLGLFSFIVFFLYRFISTLNTGKTSFTKISAFLMAIFLITSLNSTNLYSWSLVTFSFLPLSLAFACALFSWNFLQNKNKFFCIFLLFISILAIGDTASVILWIAIAITFIFLGLSHDSIISKNGFIWLLSFGFLVGSLFLAINWNFFIAKANPAPIKLSKLNLTELNFYFEIIRIVFSSSIIHGAHLSSLGEFNKVVSWLIAIPVLYFYLHHFFGLVVKRRAMNEMDFIVTFALVYASLSISAIIFGRVSEFGVGYLNQPRYLVVYQLIPFSLLIKWAFSEGPSDRARRLFLSAASTAAFIFIFAIQLLVSASAYYSVPWMWKWYIEQKNVINNYYLNPTLPSGNCTPHSIPICNMPMKKRNELLNLLQMNRLNIFDPNFQNRYRLFIEPNRIESSKN